MLIITKENLTYWCYHLW